MGTAGLQSDHPHVIEFVITSLDPHDEAILTELLGHALPPLDDDDIAIGVDIEIIEFEGGAQAIGVHVREPGATGDPGVLTGDDEGR